MTPRDDLLDNPVSSSPDGQLPRREVLRRLGLVGIAAIGPATLITACSDTSGPKAGTSTGEAIPGRDSDTPRGSEVSFTGPTGELRAAWAAPVGRPKGAVLVIHDGQGLTPHFLDLVGRFADAGYGALCVNLLSGGGQAPTTMAIPADMLLVELRAGIDELGRRLPGAKIGAIGFGFGGGLLWQLLAAGEPRLAAAVACYGLAPSNADFSRSRAAVLGIYAENDPKLVKSQDKVDAALLRANLVHTATIVDNTGDGFFDDTGPDYSPGAAGRAWQASLDWFKQYL